MPQNFPAADLLNATRSPQANKTPLAPNPACGSPPNLLLLSVPTALGPDVPEPYKLLQSPGPGEPGDSAEEGLTPRQACLPRLVSLPQRVLVSSPCSPSHSGPSAGNTSLKDLGIATPLRAGSCDRRSSTCVTCCQPAHAGQRPGQPEPRESVHSITSTSRAA